MYKFSVPCTRLGWPRVKNCATPKSLKYSGVRRLSCFDLTSWLRLMICNVPESMEYMKSVELLGWGIAGLAGLHRVIHASMKT